MESFSCYQGLRTFVLLTKAAKQYILLGLCLSVRRSRKPFLLHLIERTHLHALSMLEVKGLVGVIIGLCQGLKNRGKSV